MFQIYTKPEDIPAEFKDHYRFTGGKYVPEVSKDHPLVVNNATLKSEKETAESERNAARGEAQQAKDDLSKAKVIPHGQRAVAIADAELLDEVKKHGDAAKVKEMLTKYPTLAEQSAKRDKEDHIRKLARAKDWDEERAVLLLADEPALPETTITDGADGKKIVTAKVKKSETEFEAKPFDDVIAATPKLQALESSLKADAGGTRVIGSRAGSSTSAGGNPAQNYINQTYQPVQAA